MLKGAAVIGQSGGPSSVINASAYGAIKTALENEAITGQVGTVRRCISWSPSRSISSIITESISCCLHEVYALLRAGLLPLQAQGSR